MRENKVSTVAYTWLKNMFLMLLFGLTAYLVIAISKECATEPFGFLYSTFENITYFMYAVCVFSLYCVIGKRMNKWRNKIITASVASVVTAAGIFLLNAYWDYLPLTVEGFIRIREEFGGAFEIILQKYAAVLVGMFAACILTSFLVPKIKSAFSKFFTIERFVEKFTLIDYADRYVNKADYFEMIDYLQNMPKNEEGKRELLKAVNVFGDIQEFYGILFTVYGDMLTEDEKGELKMKYEKAFNEPWQDE